MGTLDSFKQSREKQKGHTIPPPEGQTLAEILKDKNKFHLFSKLLDRYGREDLASRFVKGELREGDISLLHEERVRFLEIMAQIEQTKKLLTPESISGVARNHPEFQKILSLSSPEEIKEVLESGLEEMAFTDEYRFDRITDLMQAYDSYKGGKYKKVEAQIEKMCEDGKFTPEEYWDALAIEDSKEKRKALKELAGRAHGKFKKVVNFLSRGKLVRNRLEDLEASGILVESSFEELDGYQRDIGSQLFLSVDTNEHMRNALARELIDDRAPEEPKLGFSDIKREAASIFDEKEEERAWGVFKEREAYSAAYNYEQDALKDKFIDEQKRKHREKSQKNKGLWASVLAALFEGNINNMKGKLK